MPEKTKKTIKDRLNEGETEGGDGEEEKKVEEKGEVGAILQKTPFEPEQATKQLNELELKLTEMSEKISEKFDEMDKEIMQLKERTGSLDAIEDEVSELKRQLESEPKTKETAEEMICEKLQPNEAIVLSKEGGRVLVATNREGKVQVENMTTNNV